MAKQGHLETKKDHQNPVIKLRDHLKIMVDNNRDSKIDF